MKNFCDIGVLEFLKTEPDAYAALVFHPLEAEPEGHYVSMMPKWGDFFSLVESLFDATRGIRKMLTWGDAGQKEDTCLKRLWAKGTHLLGVRGDKRKTPNWGYSRHNKDTCLRRGVAKGRHLFDARCGISKPPVGGEV